LSKDWRELLIRMAIAVAAAIAGALAEWARAGAQ